MRMYGMIRLKACSRCGGDMNSRADKYGPYMECLQCGHMIDEAKSMFNVKQAVGGRPEAA
jgi:tRNA(Ile2) C34 agmatinyltransferase TiaS